MDQFQGKYISRCCIHWILPKIWWGGVKFGGVYLNLPHNTLCVSFCSGEGGGVHSQISIAILKLFF